jgi:glycosyltransferase involved in cell wall biosynthesis
VRILVSAYACEPRRGSEPGVGWNWVRELARHHEVWVLTRTNNRRAIERQLSEHPGEQPSMRFLYVDLPERVTRHKRGQRWVHLYYYAWQFAARRVARRAHADTPFDVVHHVTFASAFSPALVRIPGVPFVWGPVGGGVRVPWRLAAEGGTSALVYEGLRAAKRLVGRYLDPWVRATWRDADLILVQNRETLAWLPRRHRSRARIQTNCGVDDHEIGERRTFRGRRNEIVVVAAGRLIHLKGFSLGLRAMAEIGDPRVRMVVVGEGPQRGGLEALAADLGLDGRVAFTGAIPRAGLLDLFAHAEILLFPSLHDEAGFVVVEAMAQGAIPIVLEVGGPGALVGPAGYVVPARGRSRRSVVADLASALGAAAAEDLDARRAVAIERARGLAWSTKTASLAPVISSPTRLATPRSA